MACLSTGYEKDIFFESIFCSVDLDKKTVMAYSKKNGVADLLKQLEDGKISAAEFERQRDLLNATGQGKSNKSKIGIWGWLAIVWGIFFVLSMFEGKTNSSTSSPENIPTNIPPDYDIERDAWKRDLEIVKWSWEAGGFGTVGIINVRIKNKSLDRQYSNVKVQFKTYGNSETMLDIHEETIYEIFESGKTKRIGGLNVGFINQQSKRGNIEIIGAEPY